jgi:hypothetical protein
MRITIEIPTSIIKKPGPSPSDPPLIQIGGDLVIMELQGDLTFEGNPQGKVIGLLGLERMVSKTSTTYAIVYRQADEDLVNHRTNQRYI